MYGEILHNQAGDWEQAKTILLAIAKDSNQPGGQIIALCYLLTEADKLDAKESEVLDDIICNLENRKVLDEAQRMIASQ